VISQAVQQTTDIKAGVSTSRLPFPPVRSQPARPSQDYGAFSGGSTPKNNQYSQRTMPAESMVGGTSPQYWTVGPDAA